MIPVIIQNGFREREFLLGVVSKFKPLSQKGSRETGGDRDFSKENKKNAFLAGTILKSSTYVGKFNILKK